MVATDTALIGDGHIRNNLMPAGGASVRLTRKVGESMARWLALSGSLLTPRELAATGWIHAVVPDEHLADTAMQVATTLAAHHGPAQSRYKKLLNDTSSMTIPDGLQAELDEFENHWQTSDVPSALKLFLERSTSTHQSSSSN
ncbi:enoyl-CoA hydratase/isomerase family protein [Nocardia vaccinii]|uniref:enoyl-CoA hydratase/isomerase family protein n=1 Tax=Nocardia vaccinii TaxID=1822 RepID=UPI0035A24378